MSWALCLSVDRHNAPFDPALFDREVKDVEGKDDMKVQGGDQVREPFF